MNYLTIRVEAERVDLDPRSVDPSAANLVVLLKDNYPVTFSTKLTSSDYAGSSGADDGDVAGMEW